LAALKPRVKMLEFIIILTKHQSNPGKSVNPNKAVRKMCVRKITTKSQTVPRKVVNRFGKKLLDHEFFQLSFRVNCKLLHLVIFYSI